MNGDDNANEAGHPAPVTQPPAHYKEGNDLPKFEVFSPSFWQKRLADSVKRGLSHYAVFECSYDLWRKIETAHRQILTDTLNPLDNLLDAGCGWGRLLNLLPSWWEGHYVGVDISPDFIDIARTNWRDDHSRKHQPKFMQGDLRVGYNWARDVLHIGEQFDYAVLISVRPMIVRNMGREAWDEIEKNLRRVARKLLYLEYDANDPGSVEM